ncbi:hypothetical protein [Chroococcidiopsis sp.]|uniref:hypothetical protein n=1 Tax=Chroococcidiopsis sp. TaxID=3088168 RepID=UPI003F3F3574
MTNDQLERLESLKAGIIAAATLALAFVVTTFVNNFLLTPSVFSFSSLFAGAIAVVCGFLFGVTYRYIIREDSNIQLKTGAIMAFGCVRGLTQIEMALQSSQKILPAIATAGESIVWFALAAIALSLSIRLGWVKAFSSN